MVTVAKRSKAADLALEKFKEGFGKSFGSGVLTHSNRIDPYRVIPTGSVGLDFALGSGGIIIGSLVEVWGPDGTGKGHPVDHPVLTPEGWRRIGDLIEGDFVIGRDGYSTEVTGVYDRGELDVFEVKFNDGASVVVDDDHLWTVRASKGWVTYDTRTLRTEKQLQTPEGWNRYQIPLVDYVQHPAMDLPIEPYLMGVLLANGFLDHTPVIRTNDEFVRDQVFSIASHYGETVKDATYQTSTAKGISVHGMRDRLRFLGLYGSRSGTKFIPEPYLRSDAFSRAELLAGLMDCDGSSGAKTNYHTTSRRLAEGVIELVRSLGGIARIYELDREHPDGRPYTEFTVRILIRRCPFRTPAKSGIWKSPTKLSRRMVSIEPAGRAQVRCIKVAAEDSLYVTKDYVVTHNTTLALIQAAQAQKAFPGRQVAYLDMEHKLDRAWAQKLGVDLDRFLHVQPESAEVLADMVKELITSDLVSLLVVDSIGSMVNQEEKAKDAAERSVGTTPAIVTRMVKIAASEAKAHGVVVYLINQVRASLDKYGPDSTTGGGFALKHGTVHRIKARKAPGAPMTIGSGNDAVQAAYKVALKVEKNGVSAPGRTAVLTIVTHPSAKYGMQVGIADLPREAFETGKKAGVIARSGANYTFPDGTEAKGGEEKAIELLRADPALLERLRLSVVQAAQQSLNEAEAGEVESTEGSEDEGVNDVDF